MKNKITSFEHDKNYSQKMLKIKLHNLLWWILVIAFPVSIVLALLGWQGAIYIYGGCFFISLILKRLKTSYKVGYTKNGVVSPNCKKPYGDECGYCYDCKRYQENLEKEE